ncbi:MAG: DNA polymerase III subunit epsilon, partial [Sphingomonadales bacterium]
KPLFADQVEDLLAFLGDSPLVAHNASFDFGFLNAELGACSRAPVDLGRMVDTLALARKAHPGAKHSLDALCTRYGIDRSHRVKHGALLDAQLTAQVYVELTGGRQIGLSIGETIVEETIIVATTTSVMAARTIRAIRPHMASEEELTRHTAFIEKLDAPLWLEGARS